MEIALDLHIHTEASFDGRMTTEQVIAAAKAQDLQGTAICDHDVVMTEGVREPDFLVIPGAEFSTECGHLLGLFLCADIPPGLDFASLCREIHAQGGIAVLAHPFQHTRRTERLERARPHIDGIEIWNGRANRKNRSANRMAEQYAREHDLRCFAGSDAHMEREIGNGIVRLRVDALTPEQVKQALLTQPRTIEGREGRSCDTARSQLRKLRRQRAGASRYLIWLLFALKCAWEDLICHNRRSITYVTDC